VQFDQLVDREDEPRSIILESEVARFTLIRFDNVVSCTCELRQPCPEGVEALHRRGALDGTFMISPKLSPREFGTWLDRLLVDDLGADPEGGIRVLELESASI